MTQETASTTLRERLLSDRRALLDLGTRNRLINVPLRSRGVRTIEIVDERSIEVYQKLTEGKGFTFLPGRQLSEDEKKELDEGDTETGGIPQPDEDEPSDNRGIARRHSDARLQTRLTSEGLQKRLFDVWYDARTLEEEQGVNILYLALGLLRWYDTDTSEIARHAPLILLPVRLDRTSAADRFTLRWRQEPASPNLSLQAKMNAEFGLKILDFENEDELDLPAYLATVAETVSKKARWEVMPDAMVLGFFSFAKFLMYRDLDPANWPPATALEKHPLIGNLLQNGFDFGDSPIPESGRIDSEIPPLSMKHVVDADSSQAVAIEEIVRGRHLVVKGPPGTGKSQTITNIIAAAAAEGKKVLFVAEKMAALDVVYRRLKSVGLGPLMLELHSNKANKRDVLEELKRTKESPSRPAPSDITIVDRLTAARDELNVHADRLHTPHNPSLVTPFQLFGHLVRTQAGPGLDGYSIDHPITWSPHDLRVRWDICDELAQRLHTIGRPNFHVWRGVRRDPLDPSELTQLNTRIREIRSDLEQLATLSAEATTLLGLETNRIGDLEGLQKSLRAIAHLPNCDRSALAHPIWTSDLGSVSRVPKVGREFEKLRSEVNFTFNDAAWSSSLRECRTVLAMKGDSVFRVFSSQYRAQLALLKSYLKSGLPKGLSRRLALVDDLLAAQDARRNLADPKLKGAEAFGSLWRGEASNWADLQSVVDWRASHRASLPDSLVKRLADIPDVARLKEVSRQIDVILPRFSGGMKSTVEFLDLDLVRSFDAAELSDATLATVANRMDGWIDALESFTKWTGFYDKCRAASDHGLTRIVEGVLDGKLNGETLTPTFERSYYEALRVDFLSREPWIKRFDGEAHSRLVQSFRQLDMARMSLAREQISRRHASELPRSGAGIGPLGVLNGELAKKRNHLPIRQLLDRSGSAIQQIKPIFMMSPLSVAQFLKPGSISFDLLVMDEASQIEPVDAIGAIARCRQLVVVGDERQLPPTRFFSKLTSDIDEQESEEEVTFQARDAESILDLCLAKGMPHRMLNWHYRSRHQSLIAVSNREFYENRLFIVPSPYDAVAGMGLRFNYLPDAHYDRGNTRTNPREARAVAEAVIRHSKEHPERSLGVATFSVAQRQAILKELELLRRAHPETEDFLNRASIEPFFVKNLENIQGDERDVIFISVGYGRTNTGYISMSFGPLNAEGGERRLNVLISRAKQRCEIFSSITGDDIDLERVRSRGVAALKLFLTFAQTGKFSAAEISGREPESVFEEQVADRLRSAGHEVKSQIGSAGFFIDLAVSDPEKPGRFVLGIECDGAQYHSSRSARDRDRLRQRVLEDQGWIIHRIWSADWYLRPNEELRKAEEAITAAKAEWRSRDEDLAKPAETNTLHFSGHQEGDADIVTVHLKAEESSLSVPYLEAAISVNTNTEPHEAPVADMVRYVSTVVETEGPIHENEIITRIRSAWGLARAGNRIRDAVRAGISAAQRSKAIEGGPFYILPNQVVQIRDRSSAQSSTLKRPEHLPPAEVDAALLAVVDANFGAPPEQLITATARLFGFAATSAQLREVLDQRIQSAVARGALRREGELLIR